MNILFTLAAVAVMIVVIIITWLIMKNKAATAIGDYRVKLGTQEEAIARLNKQQQESSDLLQTTSDELFTCSGDKVRLATQAENLEKELIKIQSEKKAAQDKIEDLLVDARIVRSRHPDPSI